MVIFSKGAIQYLKVYFCYFPPWATVYFASVITKWYSSVSKNDCLWCIQDQKKESNYQEMNMNFYICGRNTKSAFLSCQN